MLLKKGAFMVHRRKRNRKWLGGVIFLILIVVATAVCYGVWKAYFDDAEETRPVMTETEDGQTENVNETRENELVDAGDGEVDGEEWVRESGAQYEGEDPNLSEELTGIINYAGVSDDMLTIRVNIDQYLMSGDCRLRLWQNGDVRYEATAPIMGVATTATCEGFDVSAVGLSGDYEVMIEITSGEKTGVIKGSVGV